jgi:hypothetical protein
MKNILFFALAILPFLTSCKKDETSTPLTANTFEINASSKVHWVYFSFEKGDTVSISKTDSATSTNWDLAFRRTTILTNGGKSGIGSASVANSYLIGQTGFDALKNIPDTTTFFADQNVQVAFQGGYQTAIGNPVLNNWFTMIFGATTLIVPSDYIYIIKTAKGKYAKVWIKNYYNASNTPAFISIQYKYQADGSTNLK